MTTASGATPAPSTVAALGIVPGLAVQELGWDSDVDEELRSAVLDVLGEDFVYEALEAVDVVVLWWRSEDGDLADGLVDALTDLGASGSVWLLTPRVGRDGYVEASELDEAALTAGLARANSASVSRTWQAQKFVRPKGGRR